MATDGLSSVPQAGSASGVTTSAGTGGSEDELQRLFAAEAAARQKAAQHERELQAAQLQLKRQDAELRLLQLQVSGKTGAEAEALQEASARAAKYEQLIDELQQQHSSEVEALNTELNRLRELLADMKCELAVSQQREAATRDELETLRRQLAESQDSVDLMNKQIALAQRRADSALDTQEEQTRLINELTTKLLDYEQGIHQLKDEMGMHLV